MFHPRLGHQRQAARADNNVVRVGPSVSLPPSYDHSNEPYIYTSYQQLPHKQVFIYIRPRADTGIGGVFLGYSICLDAWLWVAPEFENRNLVKPERVVVVVGVDRSI
jgi:hypothetical protein